MSSYVNISGVWNKINKVYVNVNGVWNKVNKVYVNVNGVWNRVFSGLPLGDTGVFGGGSTDGNISNAVNTIDYIIISTPSNAIDFGDLTAARRELTATSNGTNDRGVFGGGNGYDDNGNAVNYSLIDYVTLTSQSNAVYFGELLSSINNNIAATSNGVNDRGVFGSGDLCYITISTPSNAADFGDLTVARFSLAATSNGTNDRGVFGGGSYLVGYSVEYSNTIDYITISTPSNAADFGDLTVARDGLAATSNGVNDRGVFGGGNEGYLIVNTIDYITISTPSNAADFGDLTVARDGLAATSNGVNDRGVFGGSGNTIDYITISTPSNAVDFGDLTIGRTYLAATSNA